MNTQEPTTYNLGSSPMVCALGMIEWTIHGYQFAASFDDMTKMVNLVRDGWGIPEDAAEALLALEVPHKMDSAAEVVTFTYPPQE